ncbi:WD domain-containing protein [Aspergillus ruber CBS 135680]|uniref:WD domain-containing protein n=1 Tax=Aspergillus ruber (strain CBS 135680) TaxID=1388766 RepID=A0A017SNC4_ASPRC|nr:WD domain-containing protein [Aspergillus ruber CBS 135680]EYE98089.1 WD domain-containing protein [Aspergillus ruber CBS 135680]
MSVPLFIFAATVCRVFEDYDLDPVKSLAKILAYQSEESKLDGTYLPVLNRISANYGEKRKRELVKEFRDVLLGIPKGLINTQLDRLHSVLQIPDYEAIPVRLFHLSFQEFLLDVNTREKTSFWVVEKEMHQKIVVQCLTVMRRCLKKKMCKLEIEGMQRAEIDRDPINRFISPELQYFYRYWVQHPAQGKDLISRMDYFLFIYFFSILQEHLLHWAEVMSILGYASEIMQGIERLQSLI